MSRLMLLGIAVPLFACASSSSAGYGTRIMKASDYKASDGTLVTTMRNSPSPDGLIVCRNERPTGSNIMERVCRYQEDIDHIRDRTQEMLSKMNKTSQCSGAGCANSNIYGFNQ